MSNKTVRITTDHLARLIRESVEEMIAYHGTGSDFDEFDNNHQYTGSGSQTFGFGTYVTSSPAIGKEYARMTQSIALYFQGRMVYTSKNDDKENFDNPYRLIFDLFQAEKSKKNAQSRAEKLFSICDDDMPMKQVWNNVISILKQSKATDWKMKKHGVFMTVEIPDDDGGNYIDYDEDVSWPITSYIMTALFRYMKNTSPYKEEYAESYDYLQKELFSTAKSIYTGGQLYSAIAYYLDNSDELASKFLDNLGIVGIKYYAGRNFGGAKKGDTNYVIFNPKNVKILEKEMK